MSTEQLLAISVDELNLYGCPSCGYRSGTMPVSGQGSGSWRCGECGHGCCVLAAGVTKSRMGFGSGDTVIYPELQAHPRRGIPSHGAADTRPDDGEFFRSRGIGMDHVPGCFVCGGDPAMRSNIAAFVSCRDAGVRVVAMFQHGARLDYRDFEPDRVQVKIGACSEHLPNLKRLDEATRDGKITAVRLVEVAQP